MSGQDTTPGALAAALVEALPDRSFSDVRPLGQGWDFNALLVDGTWVFRVPRKPEFEPELIREIDLMARIARRLPVPVPEYAFGPLRAAALPFAFGGYPFLDGIPLVDLEPTPERRAAVARQLGDCMAVLHAIPTADLEGLPDTSYADKSDLLDFRARVKRFLPAVSGHLAPETAERARRFFEDEIRIPEPFAGSPVLRHTDVHCGHLLLRSETDATVSGVIDWSDASLGDPAGDLAELVPWASADFLDELLACYPGASRGIRERAHFIATVVTFAEIAWLADVGYDHVAARMAVVVDELLSAYVERSRSDPAHGPRPRLPPCTHGW